MRDIPAGSELLLPPKVPLNLSDFYPSDDRSDRETGKEMIIFSSFKIQKKNVQAQHFDSMPKITE